MMCKFFLSSPHQKPMPATRTYCPLIASAAPRRGRKPGRTNRPARTPSPGGAAQHPVANAQTDGQMRAVCRHPQSFAVNPLTGILGTHIVTLCYRAASPVGDGRWYSIPPTHFLAQLSSDCRPHTCGVRVCPCAAIATDPCRPTACISLAQTPIVPCSLITNRRSHTSGVR